MTKLFVERKGKDHADFTMTGERFILCLNRFNPADIYCLKSKFKLQIRLSSLEIPVHVGVRGISITDKHIVADRKHIRQREARQSNVPVKKNSEALKIEIENTVRYARFKHVLTCQKYSFRLR